MPPGTVVEDPESGDRWDLLARASARSSRAAAAAGAATSSSRPPRARRRASPSRGCPARSAGSSCRLKLLADAGLVGLPNAGKSSLLARLTRAQPKVADYPFTTLEPVLGTLERDDRQLVLADIPGLIEGASGGAGLGHEFLAHVERCRLLVHVLDLAPLDGSDPADNHATVEAELREHGHGLAELPRILCLSKADLVPPGRPSARSRWRERLGVRGGRHLGGHRGGARRAARRDLQGCRPRSAREDRRETPATHRVYRPGRGDAYSVRRTGPGAFRVEGERIERLIARHDMDNEEALRYVEERLRALGVIKALEAAGFEPGDDVEIGGIVFELDPG